MLDSTSKDWYYGHPEARNYSGIPTNIDNTKNPFVEEVEVKDLKYVKNKLEGFLEVKSKGLYSADGYVSIDDSTSNFLAEDGTIIFNDKKRIDVYVFMYNKDFGSCLQSYYLLTGMPQFIPR